MARPVGSKNNMRSPEEKATIVEEYINGHLSTWKIAEKYGTTQRQFRDWKKKYLKYGIEGLKSKTGTKTGGTKGQGARKPKTIEEELKRKIAKLEIENERLKKGYVVKGVGDKKEFVTTFDSNTK